MQTNVVNADWEAARSGSCGRLLNAARSGFLPIPLSRVPVHALRGIPVFLRRDLVSRPDPNESPFAPYRLPHEQFTEEDRKQLASLGVRFLYVRMSDQQTFRRQTEAQLVHLAGNTRDAITQASEIVYETSVELINELLAHPALDPQITRLENIARSVTTLVINDPRAFSHLFAASHHDFYTATHMVNVATWMIPLAYDLGYRDNGTLGQICQAGLLHDIGKVYLPESTLNKPGPLTEDEWELVRRHPILGCEHLAKYAGIPSLVMTITRQHHERLDGTGYPDRLKGDEIHPVSRICAVVDSFDAMTAFRPYKSRTLSVDEALEVLQRESPSKYDPAAVQSWVKLVKSADPPPLLPEPPGKSAKPQDAAEQSESNRRRFRRFTFNIPARVHALEPFSTGWKEMPGVQVTAHNVSRAGLGFLSRTPIEMDEYLRAYLRVSGWSRNCIEGRVVRCRAYEDGWFDIGMALVNIEKVSGNPSEQLPAALH